jgi:predicted permease
MSFSDLKYAARTLRKSPVITITAIAALALGIGANTALFSVVNAVLLRPMNYPHAERIVEITRSFQGGKFNSPSVTATKFDFWRTQNQSFEAVAAYDFLPLGINLTGRGEPQRLSSLPVTAGFFQVLGVQPFLGRSFSESEDKPGAGHFAVISYGLWQRLFDGDRHAVGRTVTLNNAGYTVLGVMPRDFDFPEAADVWTPIQLQIDPADHSNNYKVIGRLKSGVSLQQAAEDMRLVGQRFRQRFSSAAMDDTEDVSVIGFHSWIVGNVRPMLLVLMGAVGFVLLIACANVANLLLARSAARRQEMAVRAALGASGGRLMRLLFTESLLLSLAGAALGILVAQSSLPLLLGLAPANLPLLPRVSIDWGVILFAVAIAVLTGFLFALFPALQSIRLGIGNPLRDSGNRTTANASANRARQVLVVAEVAISLILLIGAGLLIQTFKNLSGVDPGFDTRHVLTTQMSVSDDRFRKTAAVAQLTNRIVTRLEAMPGVAAVATTITLPTEIGPDLSFEIVGRPPSNQVLDEQWRSITPHYFSALQIPVVAGRAFTLQDTQQSRAVVIVNEAFARKHFPKQSPIGRQILIGRGLGPIFADRPRQIVGVVGDTRDTGLGAPPPPILYEPLAQVPDGLIGLDNQLAPLNWVIRTSSGAMPTAEQIRRETLTASGGVPMAEPRLLERVVGASISRQRFSMALLAIFAGLAMLLGAIGIYGVISYSVAQRTRELGIRSALGATRGDLLKLVIGQGMWLAGIGLMVGLFSALGLTQFLRGMLYGVTAFDPVVLISVTALLAAVALAACWFPARRAARIDPAVALRQD